MNGRGFPSARGDGAGLIGWVDQPSKNSVHSMPRRAMGTVSRSARPPWCSLSRYRLPLFAVSHLAAAIAQTATYPPFRDYPNPIIRISERGQSPGTFRTFVTTALLYEAVIKHESIRNCADRQVRLVFGIVPHGNVRLLIRLPPFPEIFNIIWFLSSEKQPERVQNRIDFSQGLPGIACWAMQSIGGSSIQQLQDRPVYLARPS